MKLAPPDFKKAYASGRSVANRYLVLYYLKRDQEENRLGFSISKRVGSAVERNRLKRRLNEIYRSRQAEIKKAYDLAVICRAKAASLSFQNLEGAFIDVLVKAGLKPVCPARPVGGRQAGKEKR